MFYLLLIIIVGFTVLNEYKYKEDDKMNENVIIIKRSFVRSGAVLGKLIYKDLNLYTLESEKDKIPKGKYSAYIRNSPSNGKVIELKGVTNRTYIQIHSGNYLKDTEGCILVGLSRSMKVPAVWNSVKAKEKLLNIIDEKNLKVEVV